jgi:hypothetical protein
MVREGRGAAKAEVELRLRLRGTKNVGVRAKTELWIRVHDLGL